MGFKLSLTTVSKLWHALGQEVLWDFVWIRSGKHAERVLGILDAKAPTEGKRVETYAYHTRNLGRHIRRLHIEPSSDPALDFDRCNPETILRILKHAKGLQVFSDFRGIRRRSKFGVWDDDPLLTALLSPSSSLLKRLSWTSYDHPVPSLSSVVGPKIQMAAERLEFLELTLCAGGLGRESGGWLDSMLELPVLRSLKATLDNATFHVLSTWSIPVLLNLSVISADFSYAGDGFREFFEAHGAKLRQLELGHSTEAIEDHFLSASPQPSFEGTGWRYGGMRIPLAEWCPGIEQFIFSAEAEWNWQDSDWITPHILLPAHPTLELIGVRGLEKCIREGLNRLEGDEAFLKLTEQFGSLFNREAYPALKYVRDLGWESAAMRSGGLQRRLVIQQHRRVLRFWMCVLEICRERGVYLEDWAGWNVTAGEIRRVAMAEVELTMEC
ncbi:hypothetical protein FA13DRAFT_1640749 [Coprinellus micaceus]|uniref:F-box domain-containing protein n=1 Tax=Coprinellus micaceus TaxID=71717 RepID=A0A4Y7SNI5_COPMI|nr:hypothetical protein FA13DRAFT_1640749 [Coprinellus micaceus]